MPPLSLVRPTGPATTSSWMYQTMAATSCSAPGCRERGRFGSMTCNWKRSGRMCPSRLECTVCNAYSANRDLGADLRIFHQGDGSGHPARDDDLALARAVSARMLTQPRQEASSRKAPAPAGRREHGGTEAQRAKGAKNDADAGMSLWACHCERERTAPPGKPRAG